MKDELINSFIEANKEIKELFPYYRRIANENLKDLRGVVEQEEYNSIASMYHVEFQRIKELIKKNELIIDKITTNQ